MKLTIREEVMSPTFTKYHIEGFPFPLVIHRFTGADDEEFHDHPFRFTSLILSGGYTEQILYEGRGFPYVDTVYWGAGESHSVEADTIHRIVELDGGEECYTAIVPGQKVQEPAFYRTVERGGKIERRQWNEKEFKPYQP